MRFISMALVAEDGREWYEVVPCGSPGMGNRTRYSDTW